MIKMPKEVTESPKVKKKRKKGLIISIIISVFIIICALAAVTAFDIFELRTKYFQNIPIVKNLFFVDDKYKELSKEELVKQINELQKKLEANQTEINNLSAENDMYVQDIDMLNAKIVRLEGQQPLFNAQKSEFERLVALNDKNAYVKFYESIDPQRAENLYKEAVVGIQNNKDLKNYVAAFKTMDESSAASIFEQMIGTDMDLVVLILKNLDAETRGAILGMMSPANAASVTKMMYPKQSNILAMG